MNPLASTLLDGLRAAFLRHPRGTTMTAGAGLFVALIVVYLVVESFVAWLGISGSWQFDAAGIVTVLTDSLLTLIAAWMLTTLARRRAVVWGAASILLAATIATVAFIHWPAQRAATALMQHDHVLLALLLAFVARSWWFLVLLAFAHWLSPRGLVRVLCATALAYAVSGAAWWWLPESPLVVAADTPDETRITTDDAGTQTPAIANEKEDEDDKAPDFDAEAVMYDQAALLDAALAKLAPQTPGKVDLYVIAFAGDAEEDVFRNEAEYAEHLFGQRFGAEKHVVVLENNAATVSTRPLATWTNLHRTLDAVAKKMDPAEDILLVYLSTHGSSDHQLLIDLDPLPLNQIEPDDLTDALKTTPRIRWKVIVVNACYSGGFVDALRDDSTMVMTSARADRTSFGCGADSDITYFGKAFLVEALNKTTSLRDAFDLAKASVAQWEEAEKEEHSEPQLATSASIEAKLAGWQRSLHEAAPVPFAPAAAADAQTTKK